MCSREGGLADLTSTTCAAHMAAVLQHARVVQCWASIGV